MRPLIIPSLVISFAITAALATFSILYVTFSHPVTDFFDTGLFGAVFVSYSDPVISAGVNNGWVLAGLFAAIFAVVFAVANLFPRR